MFKVVDRRLVLSRCILQLCLTWELSCEFTRILIQIQLLLHVSRGGACSRSQHSGNQVPPIISSIRTVAPISNGTRLETLLCAEFCGHHRRRNTWSSKLIFRRPDDHTHGPTQRKLKCTTSKINYFLFFFKS